MFKQFIRLLLDSLGAFLMQISSNESFELKHNFCKDESLMKLSYELIDFDLILKILKSLRRLV